MQCPRCGTPLEEHEPNIHWNRWWECIECDLAYHLVEGVLEQGRERPYQIVR